MVPKSPIFKNHECHRPNLGDDNDSTRTVDVGSRRERTAAVVAERVTQHSDWGRVNAGAIEQLLLRSLFLCRMNYYNTPRVNSAKPREQSTMENDWVLRPQNRDGNDHGSTNTGREVELIKGPGKRKRKRKYRCILAFEYLAALMIAPVEPTCN